MARGFASPVWHPGRPTTLTDEPPWGGSRLNPGSFASSKCCALRVSWSEECCGDDGNAVGSSVGVCACGDDGDVEHVGAEPVSEP